MIRLIIINISGDILRAFIYMIFSTVALSGYEAPRHSALCQVTGYFLSVGHGVTGMDVCS
jgi:hypothetical protein